MAKLQKKASVGGARTTPREIKDTGKEVSKSNQIIKLLKRKTGADIDDLQKATGWQAHSIRGFLSGLRKRGMKVERLAVDGQKSAYHIAAV